MDQNSTGNFELKIERPPSLSYLVEWATAEEKDMIIRKLRADGRQTMNVRLMPTSKFIVLRDVENGNRIIGFQGVDWETNPLYPEKFSLHLDSEYRSFLLGLVLEHACAIHLRSIGITYAYSRMDTVNNSGFSQFRINNGLYTLMDQSELDPNWVSKCQQCEIYKTGCKAQGYFRCQISTVIAFCDRRLGIATFDQLPARVTLREEFIRKGEVEAKRYQAKWAA